MNGHYLNEEDLDRIVELVIPYFQRKYLISEDPSQEEMDYLRKVVEAVAPGSRLWQKLPMPQSISMLMISPMMKRVSENIFAKKTQLSI